MVIHVLPGDAQVEVFAQTGIDGDVVVCREALIDGDVAARDLGEFWRVRESFLTKTYPDSQTSYRTGVVAEFEKLLDLPNGTEVNLWFEHELFCQVNMWFCVSFLRGSAADVLRVGPLADQNDRWRGFGAMTPDELKSCYDERAKFSGRDRALGADLWIAYQDHDHAKLRELSTTESACFPFLKDVCDAELDRETRPKQVLKELRQNGGADFDEIFAAFRERAGVYGFGDAQVKRLLSEI